MKISRRKFLKALGISAAVAIVSPVRFLKAEEPKILNGGDIVADQIACHPMKPDVIDTKF